MAIILPMQGTVSGETFCSFKMHKLAWSDMTLISIFVRDADLGMHVEPSPQWVLAKYLVILVHGIEDIAFTETEPVSINDLQSSHICPISFALISPCHFWHFIQ